MFVAGSYQVSSDREALLRHVCDAFLKFDTLCALANIFINMRLFNAVRIPSIMSSNVVHYPTGLTVMLISQ